MVTTIPGCLSWGGRLEILPLPMGFAKTRWEKSRAVSSETPRREERLETISGDGSVAVRLSRFGRSAWLSTCLPCGLPGPGTIQPSIGHVVADVEIPL